MVSPAALWPAPRRRVVLLGLLLALACALPLADALRRQQADLDIALDARAALDPLRTASALQQRLQEHRALAGMVLAGNRAAEDPRRARQADVSAQFDKLDRMLGRLALAQAHARTLALRERWQALVGRIEAVRITPEESFQVHTDLVEGSIELMDLLATASALPAPPAVERPALPSSSALPPRATAPGVQAAAASAAGSGSPPRAAAGIALGPPASDSRAAWLDAAVRALDTQLDGRVAAAERRRDRLLMALGALLVASAAAAFALSAIPAGRRPPVSPLGRRGGLEPAYQQTRRVAEGDAVGAPCTAPPCGAVAGGAGEARRLLRRLREAGDAQRADGEPSATADALPVPDADPGARGVTLPTDSAGTRGA